MTGQGARRRQRRIGAQIQQGLSDLLQRELHDPGLGFATVTAVRMSSDLKSAQIYISVMGDDQERRSTMAALKRGEGFIRRELASRLKVRYMPEITFSLDLTLERAARLDALLDQASPSSGEPVHEGESADDGDGP
jgi:ribosome-binding factor A